MKVVIGLLVMGILGAVAAAQPGGTAADATSETKTTLLLPGTIDFERDVKLASEQFERAKLKYEEATERARLNYIKILEDSAAACVSDEIRAVEFEQELKLVRGLKFHRPQFEYTTYQWENHAPPVRMIHRDEGFCYLSDIGGAFNGGGEVARVSIGDDGFWYLHGSTGNGFLVVRATAVKITR